MDCIKVINDKYVLSTDRSSFIGDGLGIDSEKAIQIMNTVDNMALLIMADARIKLIDLCTMIKTKRVAMCKSNDTYKIKIHNGYVTNIGEKFPQFSSRQYRDIDDMDYEDTYRLMETMNRLQVGSNDIIEYCVLSVRFGIDHEIELLSCICFVKNKYASKYGIRTYACESIQDIMKTIDRAISNGEIIATVNKDIVKTHANFSEED